MIKRGLAVVALGALFVGQALAFTFQFNSVGTFTLAGTTLTVVDNNVVYDASTSPVDSITYNYSYIGPVAQVTAGTGMITLVDSSTIDFAFNGGIVPNVDSDALAGAVVTFSNGTGTLAGMSGLGSISNTTWRNTGEDQTTFVANLVPEPTSMGILAVAGLSLLARRRRSK